MAKPHLFIGSSTEGKEIAEAIQVNLEYEIMSTIWYQGVLDVSSGTLQSLVKAVKEFDFAVLVLTPDDMIVKRGQSFSAPRDNVLFELGLFMGYLGTERTFIVHPRDRPVHLPSDLAGVTTVTFETPARQTLLAALGAACTRIKSAIAAAPPRPRLEPDGEGSTVYSELRELRNMVARLISPAPTAARRSVAFLEGVWQNVDTGSTYYCRIIRGQPHAVYSYGGTDGATGEYYNWQLVEDELFGQFRWFNGAAFGHFWLRIENNDSLLGGWWLVDDMNEPARPFLEQLRKAKGMQPMNLVRSSVEKYPRWANTYFAKIMNDGH